jgi:hypothetical protein
MISGQRVEPAKNVVGDASFVPEIERLLPREGRNVQVDACLI